MTNGKERTLKVGRSLHRSASVLFSSVTSVWRGEESFFGGGEGTEDFGKVSREQRANFAPGRQYLATWRFSSRVKER